MFQDWCINTDAEGHIKRHHVLVDLLEAWCKSRPAGSSIRVPRITKHSDEKEKDLTRRLSNFKSALKAPKERLEQLEEVAARLDMLFGNRDMWI